MCLDLTYSRTTEISPREALGASVLFAWRHRITRCCHFLGRKKPGPTTLGGARLSTPVWTDRLTLGGPDGSGQYHDSRTRLILNKAPALNIEDEVVSNRRYPVCLPSRSINSFTAFRINEANRQSSCLAISFRESIAALSNQIVIELGFSEGKKHSNVSRLSHVRSTALDATSGFAACSGSAASPGLRVSSLTGIVRSRTC